MALVHTTIKQEIKDLMNTAYAENDPDNRDAAIDNYADSFATTIINAIESALLTIPIGTIITTGTAVTQTQSNIGVVDGGLS